MTQEDFVNQLLDDFENDPSWNFSKRADGKYDAEKVIITMNSDKLVVLEEHVDRQYKGCYVVINVGLEKTSDFVKIGAEDLALKIRDYIKEKVEDRGLRSLNKKYDKICSFLGRRFKEGL